MNDWHSAWDLARVSRIQNVTIFPGVPVFGEDETYITLLVEQDGDAWSDAPLRGCKILEPSQCCVLRIHAFFLGHAKNDRSRSFKSSWRTKMGTKTRRGGGSTWSRSTGGDEWRVSKTFSTIQRRKQGRRRSLAGRSWLIICRKARNLYISYLMMQQHEDVGHDAARAVQRPFQAICRMDGVVFHAWSGSSSSSIPLQALMWLLKTFWHPIWMRAGFISSFSQRQPCSSGAHIAKWLVKRVDVDKYMVFKEKIMYFDHQESGPHRERTRRFRGQGCQSWSEKGSFFMSTSRNLYDFIWSPASYHRCRLPKQVTKVDNTYRTSVHWFTCFKNPL